MFGSESKPPAIYHDATIPRIIELKKRISITGKQLAFPKMNYLLCGVRDEILLGEWK